MDAPTHNIACRLSGPELQKRKADLISRLSAEVKSRQETPDGFTYVFNGSDETLEKIIVFIKDERLCCPFFRFNLTIEDTRVTLTIGGPEGAKAFLEQEIEL